MSNNLDLRTFKVKYPANLTVQPYGATLRRNPTTTNKHYGRPQDLYTTNLLVPPIPNLTSAAGSQP